MTSRFPPFAFVELVSPYNKKNITRWLEDMNFMFSWQEQYLTCSLRLLVRYCSCHSNIKSVSSRHRVISSMYSMLRYSTLLYYTHVYYTLLFSTLRYSTLLYVTLPYSTLLYSTVLYSTLLSIALFTTIRYNTLHYSTLYRPLLVEADFLLNVICS